MPRCACVSCARSIFRTCSGVRTKHTDSMKRWVVRLNVDVRWLCRRCSQLFARYSNSGLQSMEVRSSCVGAIPLFSRDDFFSSHVLWLARIITLRQGILC